MLVPLTISFIQEYVWGCLLGGVHVPCTYRMPGGVVVGDSGLCCCVSVWTMCDVNRLRAITSHCLLILQKCSRPHSVADYIYDKCLQLQQQWNTITMTNAHTFFKHQLSQRQGAIEMSKLLLSKPQTTVFLNQSPNLYIVCIHTTPNSWHMCFPHSHHYHSATKQIYRSCMLHATSQLCRVMPGQNHP